MDDWKYKIVEIAEDMAGEDGLDYSELSDKDQLKYYGKAYEYYLDRPEKAIIFPCTSVSPSLFKIASALSLDTFISL